MKNISTLFLYSVIIIFSSCKAKNAGAISLNYKEYYQNINKADSIYFIEKNYSKGLELYKKTLSEYDFVWVDACIKFAQLALINQKKDLALYFIKRAIDNGFELELVTYLNLGCVCNIYKEIREKNNELIDFIKDNKTVLQQYYNKVRPKYVQTIKRNLLKRIIYDHVTDEFWKNSHDDINKSLTTHQRDKIKKERYANLRSKNTQYIERLFSENIWIGERNLGRYTNQLMKDLKLEDSSINAISQIYISKYNLTGDRPIPVSDEDDYFSSTPYFITLHHGGLEAVQMLTRYKDSLINNGYLHPREYAYLATLQDKQLERKLLLHPEFYIKDPQLTTFDNNLRRDYLLPSFEIDKAKHDYAHQHKIKLFFGFFNCSR